MRFRRHMRPGFVPDADAPAEPEEPAEPAPDDPRRRAARDVAIVLLVAVVGFLVAAVWLSPVPIFSREDLIPQVAGSDVTSARQQLTGLGYRVRIEPAVENPDVPRGTVVRQDPPSGTAAPRGTVVMLTPSAGRMPVPVPDVVGLEMGQASRGPEDAGLVVGEVDSAIDRRQDGGVVLGTRPAAGQGRDPGSPVDLIVNGADQ